MCVCLYVCVCRRRSPGSAVITGCCLRSLIFVPRRLNSGPPPDRTSSRISSFLPQTSVLAGVLLSWCPRETPRLLFDFPETLGDRLGSWKIMEAWFLNHVLGLSLSVLLMALPGPLGAWTPGNNSTDPVTAGFDISTATDELSNEGSNATSVSYSSESLSPSQRNILLTHRAETETETSAAAGRVGKNPVITCG